MAGSASESPLKQHNFDKRLKYVEDGVADINDNKDINMINVKGKESMSARKLAATLWEINGLHSPTQDIFKESKGRNSPADRIPNFEIFDSADPHTPASASASHHQAKDESNVKGHSHRRRSSTASHKLEITEYIAAVQGLQPVGKASSIEVASPKPGLGEKHYLSIKTRFKEVNNSLITSKELAKVLYRMLSQEEQHSSRITIVSALRVELDRARHQVEKLNQEQRLSCNQMDALLKQIAEEKAAWKSREKERTREAVSSLTRELEIERKLRRQAERLNKKLGMELADTRAQFSKAVKELDGERRAREILEQTCDELAREIGEERVEVEELKRESAQAREEVEKERQMLQLADVLREERVQMKLAEARYEFEEKNAALEKLKTEVETCCFLKGGGSIENGDGTYPEFDDKTGLRDFLNRNPLIEIGEGGVDSRGEDSGDSELHSIELNMDSNNRSYKWSFACEGNNQGDTRRASVDEVFKGRRSLSEKIQWESICLQRKTSDGGIEWDFTKQGNANGLLNKGRSSKLCQDGERNELVDDFKSYNPVKSQKLLSCQGSASPSAMSTGNSSHLREACSAILQDLASRTQLLEGHRKGNKI